MEASWGRLGALWGPSWAVLGGSSAQDGAKIEEKMVLKIDLFFCCLWRLDFSKILIDFGSQNGAKLAPKLDQKSMSTSEGDFSKKTFFFERKSKVFGDPRGRSWDENSIKNR